jgi:hypothetical protein
MPKINADQQVSDSQQDTSQLDWQPSENTGLQRYNNPKKRLKRVKNRC